MEDMKQCVTDANERKYGLWYLRNENTASRKCKCCGIDFYYPINKWVLIQIKKQQQALKLLESFLNLSFDDPNFIDYLNVILEDVVDYIEDTETFQPKTLLDKKLTEFSLTYFVSEQSKRTSNLH